jgi:hypothetical protein
MSAGIPIKGRNTATATKTQSGTPASVFLIQSNAAENAPVTVFHRFTKKVDTLSQFLMSRYTPPATSATAATTASIGHVAAIHAVAAAQPDAIHVPTAGNALISKCQ